jgi:hypothetical protein
VYGDIGGSRVIARFPSTTHLAIESGQPIDFAIRRPHVKRFDPETGLRVYGDGS